VTVWHTGRKEQGPTEKDTARDTERSHLYTYICMCVCKCKCTCIYLCWDICTSVPLVDWSSVYTCLLCDYECLYWVGIQRLVTKTVSLGFEPAPHSCTKPNTVH